MFYKNSLILWQNSLGERSEVDLDNGSLKEIALAFENEIRPILLKSGIGLSDLKIIAVA